jgi:hypothetical protein
VNLYLAATNELPAAEEPAIEIGFDDQVEFVGRHLGDVCSATAHAGIVDEDVGRAEFAGYRLEQASDASFIPNIGLPHNGFPACRLYPAAAFFGAGLVCVEDAATFAPARANSSAIAWPIPESEPVMRAVLCRAFPFATPPPPMQSPPTECRFSSSTRIRRLRFRADRRASALLDVPLGHKDDS